MEIIQKIAIPLIACFILIKINQKIFHSLLKKQRKIHLNFLSGMITVIIVFIAISMIGMEFEGTQKIFEPILKNTALFVAVAGFAAQQTLNNIISGLMLSIARPFEIGERIYLVNSGITGTVETITLRHTVVKGFDNQRFVIPNSVMNSEILRNSNYDDSIIGNYLEVTISYESDLRKAVSVFESLIVSYPLVLTNETHSPGVIVKELSESGVVLKATIWTQNVSDNFKASSEIRIQLTEEFQKENIEIPHKKF